MSRVVALVEGQTEQAFIQEVLAPVLGVQGVFLTACIVGQVGHKGGVGTYQRAKRDMIALLRQSSDVYCTLMFDYYGMPEDWPGKASATAVAVPSKATHIETAIAADIVQTMGGSFKRERFIPYVQMHEFEALLFSDCQVLADVMLVPTQHKKLQSIVDQYGHPEAIDDNPLTAPSKRIAQIAPKFRKIFHGSVAIKRIGLEKIRQQCAHFNDWYTRLEQLNQNE